MLRQQYSTLRLILGDQLNASHSWFQALDDDILYVMFELNQELSYTTHHVQKVCAFFLSMRGFYGALKKAGHQVVYFNLDESQQFRNLDDALRKIIDDYSIAHFEYQLPDEYRLDEQLISFCKHLNISFKAYDTEHFLTARDDLENFFHEKKTYLMENFYRQIRKQWHILMNDDEPVGKRWNFDSENRKALPKSHNPVPHQFFKKDVSEIVSMLNRHNIKTMGDVDETSFIWPTSRNEARNLLTFFVENLLPNFGRYQDAMVDNDPFIYHSCLSFCMNSKMLHPLEVVNRAVQHWENNKDDISLAQVEGFVRQIIGWREYMRGVYWAKMPSYAALNYFKHNTQLPGFYWTANTRMNCMKHAISQSLEHAYAHHIQRLMVTGNFALLAGIDPDEVDSWYLGIYIDALQWVEITNTRGMSQFADGGIVGTKPYVSSGNYINKMSNYCKSCHYQVKLKHGEDSCPFNSLYWHFLNRHSDKLKKNPRMGMVYRIWDKMDQSQQQDILETADYFLNNINQL